MRQIQNKQEKDNAISRYRFEKIARDHALEVAQGVSVWHFDGNGEPAFTGDGKELAESIMDFADRKLSYARDALVRVFLLAGDEEEDR